ncbi:hypothetical protein BO71DRAFT_398687 [Aspergillus ellipticus CBS 707.79]|uniref:Uncharacterized protein n=1 Tax=Aspergillus ellipticus CBS 707.79 TaxID=1448320 RepID=A0A319DBE5_9EURO|nr:hypothetical protein BO71DRAFT_398687 [Aspergillus ellipticus CBS 707.79]
MVFPERGYRCDCCIHQTSIKIASPHVIQDSTGVSGWITLLPTGFGCSLGLFSNLLELRWPAIQRASECNKASCKVTVSPLIFDFFSLKRHVGYLVENLEIFLRILNISFVVNVCQPRPTLSRDKRFKSALRSSTYNQIKPYSPNDSTEYLKPVQVRGPQSAMQRVPCRYSENQMFRGDIQSLYKG